MRIYAIGDIHGQLEMLEAAHDRIATDRADTGDAAAPVVHLGDLVDRGPDARGVIEFLIAGQGRGEPWIVIKGNHDALFERQVSADPRPEDRFSWWASENMGGRDTAASYGVEFSGFRREAANRRSLAEAVPETHKAFLANLPLIHVIPELVFAHAGIRPGVPLSLQNEDDLMWIRGDFLFDDSDHGRLVVHGHTPVRRPEHHGNRVNLDTGAGFGRPLTAAVFEGRDCWILGPEGRVPLLPTIGP